MGIDEVTARPTDGTGRAAVGRIIRREQRARNPRSFDPLRVGRMEAALWVA
jgi:hypothetical protein